jgi:AcrR family transcriptional regulator
MGEPKAKASLILDAAAAVLAERGYAGLSARAVAERAGVNKALVFYYWGSTKELFERVLERYYTTHKASLAEAFERPGTDRERFHHVIDVYLDFMEQNGAYARIVQQQVASRGDHLPLVETHLREVLAMTTKVIAPVAGTGPLAPRHFHLSLSALVLNYFTYAPVLGPDDAGRDPLSKEALVERRAHVHWVIDAWLDALER